MKPFFLTNSKLTLRGKVLMAHLLSSLLLGLILLGASISLYSKDKVTYIYDLQDLKTAKLSESLRRDLERTISQAIRQTTKTVDVSENLLSFGIPRPPELGEIFVGQSGDANALFFRDTTGTRLAAADDLKNMLARVEGLQALEDGEVIYWLTSLGQLIGSTHHMDDDPAAILERPAVAQFLKSTSTGGLVTFVDDKRNVVAGYKEVPGTNTAVFIETPLAESMHPLRRYVFASLIIMLGFVILSLAIGYVWSPHS